MISHRASRLRPLASSLDREKGRRQQAEGRSDTLFIGAHAAILGLPILTRDVARYRTYFPSVDLICP